MVIYFENKSIAAGRLVKGGVNETLVWLNDNISKTLQQERDYHVP
jgi:hypothetical protein